MLERQSPCAAGSSHVAPPVIERRIQFLHLMQETAKTEDWTIMPQNFKAHKGVSAAAAAAENDSRGRLISNRRL